MNVTMLGSSYQYGFAPRGAQMGSYYDPSSITDFRFYEAGTGTAGTQKVLEAPPSTDAERASKIQQWVNWGLGTADQLVNIWATVTGKTPAQQDQTNKAEDDLKKGGTGAGMGIDPTYLIIGGVAVVGLLVIIGTRKRR